MPIEIGHDHSESDPLPGMRTLTVEDEGITQMQLAKILKLAGMDHVGRAMSGPDGVALALKMRPDVILMDINMPGEYDGLEAARLILKEFRTCIIMLTAYTNSEERAREIGAHGYVVKPVDNNLLLSRIREALSNFRAAGLGMN